jgi:hypothetical protein
MYVPRFPDGCRGALPANAKTLKAARGVMAGFQNAAGGFGRPFGPMSIHKMSIV